MEAKGYARVLICEYREASGAGDNEARFAAIVTRAQQEARAAALEERDAHWRDLILRKICQRACDGLECEHADCAEFRALLEGK